MKYCLSLLLFLLGAGFTYSQDLSESIQYEPSTSYPFGRINPDAPKEVGDFAPIIGVCDCKSLSRNPDGSWQDTTEMIWKFKYIMNGTAVQDEVWRDNNYAGSIRQYQPDSAKWVVTYFSYPSVSTAPGVWLGKRESDKIILFKPQTAPNGMEGFYRIQFLDMKEESFNWLGEWVNKDQSIQYPTWQIWCEKRKN